MIALLDNHFGHLDKLILILSAYILLEQFRQIPLAFRQFLLLLLLYVWLSMAFSPCVMASQVQTQTDNTQQMSALHSQMEACSYCPVQSVNMSLCQNIHTMISDSMTMSIDGIDSEPSVLFEVIISPSIIPLNLPSHYSRLEKIADYKITSPLLLTGILRI